MSSTLNLEAWGKRTEGNPTGSLALKIVCTLETEERERFRGDRGWQVCSVILYDSRTRAVTMEGDYDRPEAVNELNQVSEQAGELSSQ